MQKHNDKKRAKSLIDSFISGNTTLDDEIWLGNYFRTHDVPDEWSDYKALFAYFDAGMPLNKNELTEHRAVSIKNRWQIVAQLTAAAVIILAVCIVAFKSFLSTNLITPTQPVVAARQTSEKRHILRHEPKLTPKAVAAHYVSRSTLAQKQAAPKHKNLKLAEKDTLIIKPEGVCEYGQMVIGADYDQWLSEIKYLNEVARAECLIEQGALMALQSETLESAALKKDIQEVP